MSRSRIPVIFRHSSSGSCKRISSGTFLAASQRVFCLFPYLRPGKIAFRWFMEAGRFWWLSDTYEIVVVLVHRAFPERVEWVLDCFVRYFDDEGRGVLAQERNP